MGQGRVAGAEVVEPDLDAGGAQQVEGGERRVRGLHEGPLGDLDLQGVGGEVVGPEIVEDRLREAGVGEVTCGEVDGHVGQGPTGELVMPPGRLVDDLDEDPVVDGGQEPGLLGDLDERPRQDELCGVVVPDPHERFDGDHVAGGEVDDRLVGDAEAVLCDGASQHALRAESADRTGAEVLVEDVGSVTAPVLGSVEGEVCLLEQPLSAVPGIGGDGDAGAGRAGELLPLDQERSATCLDDPGTERDDLLGVGDVLDDDGELVTAQSGQRVLRTQDLEQPLGHLQQHGVADAVAQRVVDQLEPIEVQVQHTDEAVLALQAVERVAEPIDEHGAVGHAGQWVRGGLASQVELGLPPFGDVPNRVDDEALVAGVDRPGPGFDPAVGAVSAAEPVGGGDRVAIAPGGTVGILDQQAVVGMGEGQELLADQVGGRPSERLEPRCGHEAVDAVDVGDALQVGVAVREHAVQRCVSRGCVDARACGHGAPPRWMAVEVEPNRRRGADPVAQHSHH